jgi:hypothetical protein
MIYWWVQDWFRTCSTMSSRYRESNVRLVPAGGTLVIWWKGCTFGLIVDLAIVRPLLLSSNDLNVLFGSCYIPHQCKPRKLLPSPAWEKGLFKWWHWPNKNNTQSPPLALLDVIRSHQLGGLSRFRAMLGVLRELALCSGHIRIRSKQWHVHLGPVTLTRLVTMSTDTGVGSPWYAAQNGFGDKIGTEDACSTLFCIATAAGAVFVSLSSSSFLLSTASDTTWALNWENICVAFLSRIEGIDDHAQGCSLHPGQQLIDPTKAVQERETWDYVAHISSPPCKGISFILFLKQICLDPFYITFKAVWILASSLRAVASSSQQASKLVGSLWTF